MRSSLFKKYFSTLSVMMLICVFVLGLVLMFFSAQYFRQERNELMHRSAQNAVTLTLSDYFENGFLNRTDLEKDYATLSATIDGSVMFCGLDGVVSICSDGMGCHHMGTTAPSQGINTIIREGYYEKISVSAGSSFGSESAMLVGLPVVAEGDTVGYIFVLSSIKPFITFISDVFLVIQIASLCLILVVARIIYSLLTRMLEPLSDISAAAAAFGRGDFRARVRISGDNEIGDLGRVFNKMADDLQEMEISRRSFMGNVAHELRTPMTTIGGYIDGILDGTIPKEQQTKYLHIVSDEVKRLSRLTASTLAVARMEEDRGDSALTSVNVVPILMNVVFSAERRINAKRLEIEGLDLEGAYANCNADLLHQVLYNLVDNAVKFTPERGTITFGIKTEGKKTLISVKNTGEGISKADMPHLFDRFFKADRSRGMDKSGTGLGLYIVSTLVKKMNGEITVSSVENEYTEFIVSLELAQPPKPPKTAPAEDKQQKTGLFDIFGKRGKHREAGKNDEEKPL